jgi:hemolysin D
VLNQANIQTITNPLEPQTTTYDTVQTKIVTSNELLVITESPTNLNRDWSHAAQDILDGLPRVWTRSLLYSFILFAAIVLPWASFAKIDETGSGRGRLEPKGMVYRLDAPVTGTVTKISVKEGQNVKKGQVLIEIDSEIIKTELQQAEDKLEGQIDQLSQLNILKDQLFLALSTQRQQNQAQDLEAKAQIEQIEQNIISLQNSYRLQQEEQIAQVNQAEKSIEHNQIANKLANVRLQAAQRELTRFQEARKQGIVSEVNVGEKEVIVLENQRQVQQTQADIEQSKLRLTERQSTYQRTIKEVEAEITQAKLRLKEKQKNYQSWLKTASLNILKNEEQLKEREREITALQAEIAQNKGQITSLKLQMTQRMIKAPANGIVFELPIERTGAVVQPTQMLAQIAPENTPLILRAQMPNQETGFLRQGMPVKLKFDAYPFQDYGIVEGTLSQISPDSKIQETAQGNIEVFEVEIILDRSYIQNNNKLITLSAGQTATAEVIIRQRRLIDFILDPLKQLQEGGLEL